MMRVRIDGGQLSSDALRVDRRHQHRVRPGRRRRHRPAERAVPLDPHRGRARDLAAARVGRAVDDRGLRRRPARHARLPAGRHPRGRGPRRQRRPRRDGREVRRQPRVQQPAAQVEDVDVGLRRPLHRARDRRRLLRRRRERRRRGRLRPRGSAAGCRPTRCSPSGSASSSGPTRSPTSGRPAPSIFRDYGYRRQRNHARIKFLMADWGPEKFRQVLQDEYLHAALPDGPAPAPAKHDQRDHVGVAKQKDGANAVGFALRTGRISGSLLTRIADLADEYGAGPHPDDDAAEAGHPRRARREGRGPRRRAGRARPAGAPERLPPRHDGLHRPGVLQAGDRRDQAARAGPLRRAREAAAGLRRADRRSTSTAARTAAPGSRPPTSASRARWSATTNGEMVEGFQVHLGGHLGVEATFGRKFRGHKVTKAETADYCERVLRGYLERREPRRALRRLRRARRRGLAAVSRGRRRGKDPAAAGVPLPVLRGRGADPVRGVGRRLALRRLPAGLHGPPDRDGGARSDDRRSGRRRASWPPTADARFDGIADPVEQALAVLRWAGDTFGDDVRDHVVHGRRAARPPGQPRRSPASTSSSSTPATTSPRPSAPATGSPRVLPITLVNVTPPQTVGRAGRSRSARSCTTATPTCAARCARCSRWPQALAGYVAWGSGVRRDESPDARRHAGSSTGTPSAAWSRSTRWPPGPRTSSTPTSPSTRSRSTRCSSSATARSAARPAPARSRRARTRAPAAGRARTRPSAASTASTLGPRAAGWGACPVRRASPPTSRRRPARAAAVVRGRRRHPPHRRAAELPGRRRRDRRDRRRRRGDGPPPRHRPALAHPAPDAGQPLRRRRDRAGPASWPAGSTRCCPD